ncbi:MAG: WYL domain-containing protein [Aeromonas sp.]
MTERCTYYLNSGTTDCKFKRSEDIHTQVTMAVGISFGSRSIVTLHVSPAAADYIARRPLFPEQKIINNNADGSVLITTACIQPDHLFRWVRYWLPEITIVSPASFVKQFKDDFAKRSTDMKEES